MREIVLDTETTGVNHQGDDRVAEIGCIELMNHLATGRTFQVYINPERAMPPRATEVHGLTDAFLKDKPVFAAIVDGFLGFIEDSPLIIHNAPFDMGFLNAELLRINKPLLSFDRVIDTLDIARRKFPGAPASLDALCRRFGVDNTHRTLHGALLDCELLARVYLELIGGHQASLELAADRKITALDPDPATARARRRGTLQRPLVTEAERAAHAAFIAEMGEKAIWRIYRPAD